MKQKFLLSIQSALQIFQLTLFCTAFSKAVLAASIPAFVAVSVSVLPYLSPNFLVND